MTTYDATLANDATDLRSRRIRAGLCGKCGKRRGPEGSKSLCAEHRVEAQAKSLARLQDKQRRGVCYDCDCVNPNGKSHCDDCARSGNLRTNKRRAERRARGECIFCGDPVLEINEHTGEPFALDRKCRLRQSERTQAKNKQQTTLAAGLLRAAA